MTLGMTVFVLWAFVMFLTIRLKSDFLIAFMNAMTAIIIFLILWNIDRASFPPYMYPLTMMFLAFGLLVTTVLAIVFLIKGLLEV